MNIKKIIFTHKIITAIVVLVLAGGGYYGYQKFKTPAEIVKYITAPVTKGMLISSISGTGQVSASNKTDIKPKVAGDIVNLSAVNGQEVKAGDIIAQIDNREALKTVRDTTTALETAKLELNKLLDPPTALELLQAQSAVAVAKQKLDQLIKPDQTTINQAKNSLISAQDTLTKLQFDQKVNYQNALDAKQKASDNLAKSYEDTFTDISNAFLDLPSVITGLNNVLYDTAIAKSEATLSSGQSNTAALINSTDYSDRDALQRFITNATNSYQTARTKYDASFESYKNSSRYADTGAIEVLLDQTIETTKVISETAKSETNMLDYWVDYRSQKSLSIFKQVVTYQSDLQAYAGKINSHLSTLLSMQRTIKDDKEAVNNTQKDLEKIIQNQPLDLTAAQRAVQEKQDALNILINPKQSDIDATKTALKEKELAYDELKAGADSLDIRARKITIQEKADALLEAQQALNDHNVVAPFAGVITTINVNQGDAVSTGTIITSLITKQQIAEVTLNEIDVANVKLDQKVILKFDAVPDLSITGKVAVIDTLGTVAQNVVSYQVKIIFDTQDERIKPGMSVSASIITNSKQDVLLAPLSAVKTNGGSYVEILVNNQPQKKNITTGISNDTMMEIVDGLTEGEMIITQTINTASVAPATAPGGQQGGSNLFRALR